MWNLKPSTDVEQNLFNVLYIFLIKPHDKIIRPKHVAK